jgi:hypothetical protein
MGPRLAWVAGLRATVDRATGGQVKSVEMVDTVDPLKKKVLFHLYEDLLPQDWTPFSRLVAGFAARNDCVLERIRRVGSSLILEILLKRRNGPVMDRNPLDEKKR